jgi:hypothetical protein
MQPGDGTSPDPTHTVFEVDGQALRVSKADGEQIRDALVARIEGCQVEDRASLLARTRDAEVTLAENAVQIGSWYLQAAGTGLRLMIRLGAGASRAYAAWVAKQADGWHVDEVAPVFIHPRR